MIKRLLLPGYLVLFLCFGVFAVKGYSQDTTKKATDAKSNIVSTTTPPKIKPLHHYYHRANPTNNPTALNPKDTANPYATIRVNSVRIPGDPTELDDKSLNAQYQYLSSKTYSYQRPLISALWKNFIDTLNLERNRVKDLQAKLATENKTVSGLKADAANKAQTLSESNAKSDAISLLGIMLSKTTYNLIMFGLVIGVTIALIIVIISTAKYRLEAKHRTALYEEIEDEFKAFKAKANEKELKLARELQTERNKLNELLGRG